MLCPRCFSALRHDDCGSCLHGFGRLIHPLDLADQCSTDGCNARGIGRASPNDSITAHRQCSGGRSSTQSSAAAPSPSVTGGEVEADAPGVHRLQGVWIFALRPGPVAIVSIHQTLRLACAQVAAKPSPEVTALSASVIGVERPRWRVNRGGKRCRGRSRQFEALSAWMCMRGCPQDPTSTMIELLIRPCMPPSVGPQPLGTCLRPPGDRKHVLGGQALSLPPGTTNGITGHRGCSWVLLMQRQAQYKTGAAACVVFTVHIAVVACGDRAHQGQSQPHAARTFAGAG